MHKKYVTTTEKMPRILKFKHYYQKTERAMSFFFDFDLHSIIHFLSYLENSRKNILTTNGILHHPTNK